LLAKYGVADRWKSPPHRSMNPRRGGKNHRRRQRTLVVKSQIHAERTRQGTFKTGFSRRCEVAAPVDEAVSHAQNMLGNVLVPNRPARKAAACRRCSLPSGAKIKKEFYLAVLLDRAVGRPLVMASTEGGMDIEEVAAKTPEKIFKEWIDPPPASCRFRRAKSPPPSVSRAICSTPPQIRHRRFQHLVGMRTRRSWKSIRCASWNCRRQGNRCGAGRENIAR